jgi:hypothetical protein
LAKPSPVPAASGVYAWYFDQSPPNVPLDGTHERHGHRLLYVGIAPRRPAASGSTTKQNLRKRLRTHYARDAYGSTLRLSLGCLLGLRLQVTGGNPKRLTFGPAEATLNAWMADHARVVWMSCDNQWDVEDKLMKDLSLPLNLRGNEAHDFYPTLTSERAAAKQTALGLPVVIL